tara:strand:- start:1075 stop:1263 length:189 start_codon:yes stop_codon:yes gene_type:complete
MNNVISIREIRIKLALKEATVALVKARTLISDGKVVPEDLVPRLESVIVDLEKQLITIIEEG